MHLGNLLVYFKTAPAVRLLRSPNAPYILGFLDRQFKQRHRISIGHSELLVAFIEYQEELHETAPRALPSSAESYLSEWCSPTSRWLSRRLGAKLLEPVYQLTPHTEDVFAFLDRVLGRDGAGFVGTESRLKLVIDTLADIVVGSSDDPDRRLAYLRGEEERIRTEIERIEAGERIAKYRPAQVRERFLTAVSLLRQLQGDFRAVEESFRAITLGVQERQAEGTLARGGILEYVLDAEDVLKEEDQGVSFYEFVRLILSPSETERLEKIVDDVRGLDDLAPLTDSLDRVRSMISLLQKEAQKVMRTNRRLSSTLRRLLDSRADGERMRTAELLREIRGLAVATAETPPSDVSLSVDAVLELKSPFRRTLWRSPARFDVVDLSDYEADESARVEAFRHLAAMHRLDWSSMRARIETLARRSAAATLGDLVQQHPPTAGMVEVLGYLQIARDDGHDIDREAQEVIVVGPTSDSQQPIEVTIPLITFRLRRELEPT